MLRTADFWFALILTAFGGAVVVESWRMPRLADLGVHPMSAPGLTPGLLGLILGALGLMLLLRSVRAPATGEGGEGGWNRLALALGLCLLYAVVLLGRLPFWLATALFVGAFALAFTWRGPSMKTVLAAMALALATGVVVSTLFQQVFLVQLP